MVLETRSGDMPWRHALPVFSGDMLWKHGSGDMCSRHALETCSERMLWRHGLETRFSGHVLETCTGDILWRHALDTWSGNRFLETWLALCAPANCVCPGGGCPWPPSENQSSAAKHSWPWGFSKMDLWGFRVRHRRFFKFTALCGPKCIFPRSCCSGIFSRRCVSTGKYHMILKVGLVPDDEKLLCPVRGEGRGAIRLVKHI